MRVRNWERFQHFKDRKPTWIKVYRDLLDNWHWWAISGNAAKALIMIWLLASESNGVIPDVGTISFRLRMEEEDVINCLDELHEHDFIEEGDQPANEPVNWPTRYISKKVKEEVIKRDSGQCVWCKSKNNLEFDHIIPTSKGGNGDIENIQLLCRKCNHRKRNKAGIEAEQLATRIKSERSPETERETEEEEETERDLSLAPTAPKPIASFEAWWSGVQNKIAKKKASLAWNRVQKANNWPQEKWTSLAKALSSEQERLINSGASPIHPATWLNGERWNDDPAPTPVSRPNKFTPPETHGRRPQTLQITEPAPTPQRTQEEQEAIAEERKRAIDKILGKAVEITEFGN